MENLFAWCIVPYDSKNRTPEERIAMLKELGFNSYAYDWRIKNLDEMEHEWKLAEENNINGISEKLSSGVIAIPTKSGEAI